ncbi:MAG: hypothetical protein QM737_23090 [Ferruginibacter sp.]
MDVEAVVVNAVDAVLGGAATVDDGDAGDACDADVLPVSFLMKLYLWSLQTNRYY